MLFIDTAGTWVSPNEDASFERVGVIRAERFAAARALELEAVLLALPPLTAPAASSRLDHLGAPPPRMPLRRRAASFRPYKMPLFVRLNPRKRRKLASGEGVLMLCRARRRTTKLLASRQLAGSDGPGPKVS